MIGALVRPLRPVPLGLCLVMAALVTALYRPGIAGALPHAVALLIMLRYGYLIIERRAWGTDRDDIGNWTTFNTGFELPFKQIVVVVMLAGAYGVASHYGGLTGGYAALLLINLAAPATVVILALEHSLVEALNPWRVVAVVARIGFDYFAACFVLALFSMIGNIVLDVLLMAETPALRLFIYCAASYYYILAVFFMVAWLVERHREDLIG